MTMKAAVRIGWMGTTYSFSNDSPEPELAGLSSSHVKVKILAAGVNPVDYKVPRYMMGPIYGIDMCGIITQVSEDAKHDFKVGDVVVGPAKSGSLAEYAIANVHQIAKVLNHVPSPSQEEQDDEKKKSERIASDSWTATDAAPLPVAYCSAITGWEKVGLLVETTKSENKKVLELAPHVNPKETTMLIIGASGGCGIAALQLAKGLGIANIIAICSERNAEFCRSNGATKVVPYNDETAMQQFFSDYEGKIHHIYDAASYSGGGEDYIDKVKPLLIPLQEKQDPLPSSYVTLNGAKWNWWLLSFWSGSNGFGDKRQFLHLASFSTLVLETSMRLLNQAKLRPVVSTVLDFGDENCKKALDMLQGRRTRGKIVLKMEQQQESKEN